MKRILIVEDERHIGIGVKYNCEAEGYAAELVEDGPSAIQKLAEDEDGYDLVILDLMLPGMSGYAVLEKLRNSGVQTPVLILSARTLSEDKVRGFDLGADQYLTKPFELPELLSRVRSLMARYSRIRGEASKTATAGDDTYAFEDCSINFTRHEVTVRGEQKSLTALELKLLKYFIEREGVVLTRNELLDKVWGFDASPTTRTVDNFLVRLRQHFEIDPARPRHFLSVRGAGYKFVAQPTVPAETDADNKE
jgi:two-component system alkaline phosphatase synthesis response regulator PhoP